MAYDMNPIILNLGKKRKKVIKDLRHGEGKAMDEVHQALEEVRAGMGMDLEGKVLVPVVVIYQKKRKKRVGLLGSF